MQRGLPVESAGIHTSSAVANSQKNAPNIIFVNNCQVCHFTDVGECTNSSLCGVHAYCFNTNDSFECICDQGYSVDIGGDCVGEIAMITSIAILDRFLSATSELAKVGSNVNLESSNQTGFRCKHTESFLFKP